MLPSTPSSLRLSGVRFQNVGYWKTPTKKIPGITIRAADSLIRSCVVGDKDGKFSGFHGKRYGPKSAGKIFREFLSALKVLGERQYQLTSQSYRVLLREKSAADQVKWVHFDGSAKKGEHTLPAYMKSTGVVSTTYSR